MPQKLKNLWKALKNTCLCKLYEYTGDYRYPVSILPHHSYVHFMNIDSLKSELPFFLIRRSDKDSNNTFNSAGILREDAILPEDTIDLSLNVLGGNFKEDHIKYIPKSDGVKPWDGKKVYFIDYKNHYKIADVSSPIFFPLGELHRKTFPYYRGDDSEAKKIINALSLKPEKVDGKNKLHGSSEVKHSPTNLNYWHVELTLVDQVGKRIKKSSSIWIQSAAEMAYGHLISVNALQAAPPISTISKKSFISALAAAN